MLKIAHIAPENYTGILTDYVKGHREAGNESRLITLFPCVNSYNEDVCLNLPLVGWQRHVLLLKRLAGSPNNNPATVTDSFPKQRAAGNSVERILSGVRDALWKPRVARAFRTYGLWDFDIYHLEGGAGFLRNGAFIRELKKRGKRIVCHYHGLDLRVRGVIPAIDAASDLNITCEFDLLDKHPDIRYHFLPFDTDAIEPVPFTEPPTVRIAHSPRNRGYKGTENIIAAIDALKADLDVELVLIENRTHDEAMALKRTCHIGIDQVVDGGTHAGGGTGYGVNSLETLSLGLATCTNITDGYAALLGDHPFVNVSPATLKDELARLVTDAAYRRARGDAGRQWVRARHGYRSVVDGLYRTYRELGWTDGSMNYIPPAAP